ncbi:hypothetical protein [Burkholderia sp. Ax-1719]|uniref:hypothetical protein n=1 Tax=Burkholderia sp. Ax-1719 TaxID=2608334 RepID=UPI001423E47D|nr:hypothetical protein [Burkholderia sp. Ax-1719]NIE62797.1 hypothetical protein [Burkholderia sp. Ax-1719]
MLLQGSLAWAQAGGIALGTPEGFSANRIDALGDGRYCISGSLFDDTGPTWTAMVVMVDTRARRVLWRAPVPYPHDDVGNTAAACGSDGHSIYAVTVESTQSSEALKQHFVVVNRFSAAGKLEKQQRIPAGFDNWFYSLAVSASDVAVAGSTSGSTQMDGPFGSFVARFKPDLTPAGVTQLASGAFDSDSAASFDGDLLRVTGEFFPNKGEGHKGYAVSKVDYARKRYLWSTYVPVDLRSTKGALSATDGNTYLVASASSGALSVTTVDRVGKISSTFAVKAEPFCKLNVAAVDGGALKVFADVCKGEKTSSQLLSIDLSAHTVVTAQPFKAQLQAPGFDGGNWFGVVEAEGHGPVFVSGSK